MEWIINHPWTYKLLFETKLRAAIDSIDVFRSGQPMEFGELLDHVSLALAEHYGIEVRAVTDQEGNRCAAFPPAVILEAFGIVRELWGPLYGLEPTEDKGELVELMNDGNARVLVRKVAPPFMQKLMTEIAEHLKARGQEPQGPDDDSWPWNDFHHCD